MNILGPKQWIQTYGGEKFFPLAPIHYGVFDIRDIARALSMQCRYLGHVRRFYSVAEHSVRVSELVEKESCCRLHPVTNCLWLKQIRWGLMHDATEAYLGDIVRPMKHQPEFALYRDVEKRMQAAIGEWLNIGTEEPAIVKDWDTRILGTEARQLKYPVHPDWAKTTATGELPPAIKGLKVGVWTPAQAERAFLRRFARLFPEHKG